MKPALFLSDYDLSTVHYLCNYYKDNANLDKEDIDYINELQNRVNSLMEVTKWLNQQKEKYHLNLLLTI